MMLAKSNKTTYLTAAIILYPLIVLIVLFMMRCTSPSHRIDEERNEALENFAGSRYIDQLMKANQYSKAREAFCLMQQAVKKSDQNLCEHIININNSARIMEVCHKFSKEPQQSSIPFKTCQELFFRRK